MVFRREVAGQGEVGTTCKKTRTLAYRFAGRDWEICRCIQSPREEGRFIRPAHSSSAHTHFCTRRNRRDEIVDFFSIHNSQLPGMDGRIGVGWLSVGEELHNRWQVHRPNVKSNSSNNIFSLCLPCGHAPEIKLHDNSVRTLVTALL